MKNRQIVFIEKNVAQLMNVEYRRPSSDEVVVETAVSTVSCGTERANISGDPNVNGAANTIAPFPRTSGYSSAGTVIETGKNVMSVKPGDRVVVYWGKHAKYNTVNERNVVKINSDLISFEEAAVSFIATFSLAAIRKTRLELGESALVMGLGLLGQLAVNLLRTSGAASIIAADPVESRRSEAVINGADYALNPFDDDFSDKVKKYTCGGANVGIEVTGVGAGFNEILDCMARFGRVSLLGCTRNKNFTIDYYKKIHVPGITVIGAHTNARPDFESHPGWFTHTDDIKTVLNLCAGKRLDLHKMIKETYAPEECPKVYDRLVADKNFPVLVQFDWRNCNA